MKKCNKCNIEKPLTEFHKDKDCVMGVKNACKVCKLKLKKEWYEKNKETLVQKSRDYRKNNKDKTRQATKKWESLNVAKCRAKEARRRAAKIQRTPKWLNSEDHLKIEEEYMMAKKLEAITGDVYHVDHIVPLRGVNVSGLHVPWNLQVLEASENLSKGNRYGT